MTASGGRTSETVGPLRLSELEQAIREERAPGYDQDYEHLHGPWFPRVELEVVRRYLDLRKDDVLLDFGCGTGRLAIAFWRLCKQVVAIDRSAASLDVLRTRIAAHGSSSIEVIQADLTRPLILGPATKIVSIQLLQHIPSPSDRRQILRNAFEALAPGGRVLFVNEVHGLARRLRSRPREIARDNALFFHPFTPEEIRRNFRAAGFESVRTLGCGTLYWSRYRFVPRSLIKVDAWLSSLPGSSWVAKFVAVVGGRPGWVPAAPGASALS